MARKRPVFFRTLHGLLQSRHIGRLWIARFLRMLLIGFLCSIMLEVLTTSATANFASQTWILQSPNYTVKSPNLALNPAELSERTAITNRRLFANTPERFFPHGQSSISGMTTSSVSMPDLLQQGKVFYEAGLFAEAVKVLQQAALSAKGDNLQTAITLSNLSLAYQQIGLWKQAQDAIAQSLSLLRNLPDSPERSAIQAQTLDVQGKLQLAQGQAEASLRTWQQAADIYRQIGESRALIQNRINSAQAFQALGLYLQSKKILIEVEQTLNNQPASPLQVAEKLSLGKVLQVVGDLKESRRVLEECLTLVKSSPSNQNISEILLSLGNTARAQQLRLIQDKVAGESTRR